MASTSLMMLCMEDIQAKIVSLALTDIPTANVVIHKVPRDLEKDLPATTPFPCVIIAPTGGEDLNPNAGTNIKDDVGYPIQIIMLDHDNQSQTTNFDRNLLWREKIRQKLSNKRITAVAQSMRMVVQSANIVDPGGWTRGNYVSGLKVVVTTREDRIA